MAKNDLADRIPADLTGGGSLVDVIHRALRVAIADGRLPSGYRLREIPLAAHFDCSTTPVREAIRKLEHEGLVTIYPRRGAEVQGFSVSEIEHLYEARLVLETYAARKAAQRKLTSDQLAGLREILQRHQESLHDPESRPPVDAEFHEAVAVLGGNPVIAELVERTTRQIVAAQARTGAYVPGGREQALEAHHEILAALVDGDPRQAEKLMRHHLQWAKDALTEWFVQAESAAD